MTRSFSSMAGFWMQQVDFPGFSWAPLIDSFQLLLAASPGSSWFLLAPPGSSWLLLTLPATVSQLEPSGTKSGTKPNPCKHTLVSNMEQVESHGTKPGTKWNQVQNQAKSLQKIHLCQTWGKWNQMEPSLEPSFFSTSPKRNHGSSWQDRLLL